MRARRAQRGARRTWRTWMTLVRGLAQLVLRRSVAEQNEQLSQLLSVLICGARRARRGAKMSRARAELAALGPARSDGASRRTRDGDVTKPSPPKRPSSAGKRGVRLTPRRKGVNKKDFFCFFCDFMTRSVKKAKRHFTGGHTCWGGFELRRAAARKQPVRPAPQKKTAFMDLLHKVMLESCTVWVE